MFNFYLKINFENSNVRDNSNPFLIYYKDLLTIDFINILLITITITIIKYIMVYTNILSNKINEHFIFFFNLKMVFSSITIIVNIMAFMNQFIMLLVGFYIHYNFNFIHYYLKWLNFYYNLNYLC